MNVDILVEAHQEALRAAGWYDKQAPGKGNDFTDELEKQGKRIKLGSGDGSISAQSNLSLFSRLDCVA